MAQKAEIKIGDNISIVNPYQQDKNIKFKVNNVVSDPMNTRIYLDRSELQNLLGVNKKVVNTEMGTNKTREDIIRIDSNATFYQVNDLQTELNNQLGIVYTMVGIITVIASLISIITLVTITIIIINNNRKTISVMKVLGYTNKEIKKIITAPYRIIVISVYFLSIPIVQFLITQLIKSAFADADFQLSVTIDLKFALLGFIVIFIVYEISMYIAYQVIKKIKLAESLKLDE